jgi:potassium-transporting ATPase KdpC subunit
MNTTSAKTASVSITSLLGPALAVFLLLTLITGILYPLLVTGVSKVIYPNQAAGSLVMTDGKVIGSSLIGQNFSNPKYFWGRLSATSPQAYNASASSGSNYGPMNPALLDAAKARVDALHAADPSNAAPVPVDLITASGSGLDPHISIAAAKYQLQRVASARNLDIATVGKLLAQNTEQRQWFLFGEPRVNVLLLNLSLDQLPAAK